MHRHRAGRLFENCPPEAGCEQLTRHARGPRRGEQPHGAPWVERAGASVQTLAQRDGHAVMVRQDNILATAFHPELSADRRVHEYFMRMVRDADVGKRRKIA